MRRIVVNEEIKLLAEKYAKGLEIGKNLSAKPLNSLKDLKEAMKKNAPKIFRCIKSFFLIFYFLFWHHISFS